MLLLQKTAHTKVLCVLRAPSSRPAISPTNFYIEYDVENLIPSNDTLANDDDAHEGVMCARSTFFKTSYDNGKKQVQI